MNFYPPPVPLTAGATGYLPLNRRKSKGDGTHLLARIDAARRDALLEHNWRSSPRGLVYRIFSDRDAGGAQATERLALEVLDLPPCSPVYHVNGDSLDCRVQNLLQGSPPDHHTVVPPGSSFVAEAGYAEALADLKAQGYLYLEALRRGAKPRLNEDMVRRFFEACLSAEVPFGLKGQSLEAKCGWIKGELGVTLSKTTVHLILNGDLMKVRGFDYATLRDGKPSRTELRVQRWLERRRVIPSGSEA